MRFYNDLINDGCKGEISQMKMATIIKKNLIKSNNKTINLKMQLVTIIPKKSLKI